MNKQEYYSEGRNIKEPTKNKTVAVATYKEGADIIVSALNHYFNKKTFRENEAIEMMHNNTSNALTKIADFLEKHEYTGEMAIDYLREISDELEAQALVTSMRDELKFDKPKDNKSTNN